MIRVRLTKPSVRLVGVVAPELVVIDCLDRVTGLSTLAYLHSTARPVRSDLAENSGPNSLGRIGAGRC